MRSIRSGRRTGGTAGRPEAYAVRVLAALCLGAALLAGCQSGDGDSADAKPDSPAPGSAAPDSAAPGGPARQAGAAPARITVTPQGDGTPVDPAHPVRVTVRHGTLSSVKVIPRSGDGDQGAETGQARAVEVTGDWGAERRSWRSDRTMTPGTRYIVHVVATSEAGERAAHRTSFTTREAPYINQATVTPGRNAVVGVGQPVSIQFFNPVRNKAAVERRLSVTTRPRVEGSWGWVRTEHGHDRVDWRPRRYWAKGTKVTLRAELSGVDTGDGRYLLDDISTTFTVGTERISKVNLRTKTMTVYEDGLLARLVLVSGGRASYPTWSGAMVVLGKEPIIRMTSGSVGIPEFYDKRVRWAVHLTTSGTYLHAAPWNARLFGLVNASHGCVGMSDDDARWFFERSVPGDVVEVTGSTRRTVPVGNGYGDWNLGFEQWRELSALR